MSADRAHDDAHPQHEGGPRRRPDLGREDGRTAAPATPELLARFSPAMVSRLQSSAGSRAVSRALSTGGLAVQRLAHGKESPTIDKAERGMRLVQDRPRQKIKKGVASVAGAQAILQSTFGKTKKIVLGTIWVFPDQAALYAKYDEFAIAEGAKRPDGSAWKVGDSAKDDAAAGVQMYGFARLGTIYVSRETNLEIMAHEMLHVNASANFKARVGETFNEGATEYLTEKALSDSGTGVSGQTGYADQVELTRLLVGLVGEATLIKAYFHDVEELVRAYQSKGSKTWTELYEAAEALDTEGVKEALKPKGEGRGAPRKS